MGERTKRAPRGFVAGGLGALVGGTGSYILLALFSPMGVTTTQYLTLDAKGELELEGIAILIAIMAAGILACIGTWIGLRLHGYRLGFSTGLVMAPITYYGAVLIEDMHVEAVFFKTLGAYAWPALLAIWPFFAAAVARGVIVVVGRERADRPEDADTSTEEWPQ